MPLRSQEGGRWVFTGCHLIEGMLTTIEHLQDCREYNGGYELLSL
jgi:hypothetical protein